ncbi:hypothetical protein [Chthonobacter rhizosphaerae]|uniref:hypothetical protein n=1 Tax=Chthonobacter rhizosphaerae TaxID=2735553 RepID=UPI0015EF7A40|nr:hypothetical protein [Chthonobacter rhizosphaerae]
MSGSNGTDHPGPVSPAEEPQRLHRDPASVDGLKPDKLRDHDAAAEAGVRSETVPKPYSTERENYDNPAMDSPTDADQRRDGSAGTDVTGGR